jgi:putative thioredoxin
MQPMFAPSAAGKGADLVKDTTDKAFMEDVVNASRDVPVIVDFWAPWCGPCRQLGPALEKAVRAAKGAVKLVKINIDENPAVAGQLRIQSIPAVYAFFEGRPVDGFVGALPESQIKQFVDRLSRAGGGAPGDGGIGAALEQAKLVLEDGDTETASALYEQVLEAEPANAAAHAGLVRCRIASRDLAGARMLVEGVPAEVAKEKDFTAAASALELAEQAAKAGPVPELMERIAHNPNDHQARYDLAMALYATGKHEGAVDQLLELVRRDRAWNDEQARKQLVKFFEAFGPTDKLTVQGRRRLSSILFA